MARRKTTQKQNVCWMRYASAYGGESLRCDAATALARLERMFDQLAPGVTPREVSLRIHDAQTEALFRASDGLRADPEAEARHGERGGRGAPPGRGGHGGVRAGTAALHR